MSETFLTPEQAAKLLNLSAYTVRAYARRGIIPAHKVGRTWRFSKADLEEWVLTDGRYPPSTRAGPSLVRDGSSPARLPSTQACSEECSTAPAAGGYEAYDLAATTDRRSRAIRALQDIRARAKTGSIQTILRESRRDLLNRGRTGREEEQ